MGFLTKKKDKHKVSVDLTGINDVTGHTNSSLTSYDQLEFKVLNDVDNETLLAIADIIKSHRPIEIDFSRVLDRSEESQAFITFLSGVAYALDGRNVTINSSIIFGSYEAFKDGSIEAYITRKKA